MNISILGRLSTDSGFIAVVLIPMGEAMPFLLLLAIMLISVLGSIEIIIALMIYGDLTLQPPIGFNWQTVRASPAVPRLGSVLIANVMLPPASTLLALI